MRHVWSGPSRGTATACDLLRDEVAATPTVIIAATPTVAVHMENKGASLEILKTSLDEFASVFKESSTLENASFSTDELRRLMEEEEMLTAGKPVPLHPVPLTPVVGHTFSLCFPWFHCCPPFTAARAESMALDSSVHSLANVEQAASPGAGGDEETELLTTAEIIEHIVMIAKELEARWEFIDTAFRAIDVNQVSDCK